MCSLALRLQLSLADPPVRRLVVCLGCGERAVESARGELPARVAECLLANCGPSPSDVHNPDAHRTDRRDAHGRPRSRRRGRQKWDTAPTADFMGVWCDRLLLGAHTCPMRCALLLPRVPPEMHDAAIERALRAHRHLRAESVLCVVGTTRRPFGEMGIGPLPHEHTPPTLRANRANGSDGERDVAALWMGIGDADGPLSVLPPAEAARRLVPMAAFTAALWTVNPLKAAEYLASGPKDNARLWRTMQSAMLSTRDTALLGAYATGKPLDARLSSKQTAYLAETLLMRLESQSGNDG